MTFNIRFGAGSEKPEKPGYDVASSDAKRRAVVEAIRSVSPDVAALQEVRGAGQAEKIAALADMDYVYTRHPLSYSLDFFEWGVAFLYRLQIRNVHNPDPAEPPAGRNRRKLLSVTLAAEQEDLTLINVHFDHQEVLRQAEHLAAALAGLDRLPVLMGDFNCPVGGPELAPLCDRWVDTCRAASTEASREAEETGTLVGKRLRIDHIFVDPEDWAVQNAGLVPREHRHASDHIAYYADLRRRSA